jgi:nitroreductase
MPGISSVAVLEAINGRRSVRDFRPRRLDRPTVQALLEAAVHAPTAVHEEPWVFAVVQDPKLLARISDKAKAMWLRQMATGHAGPGQLRDAGMEAMVKRLADPDASIFYNAGTLIVIAAKPLGPFASADCWLAAQNLMLAAYGLGLGTCCIGFALNALNTPDVKSELHVPPGVTCIVAIIAGEPAAPSGPGERKPPEVVSWA